MTTPLPCPHLHWLIEAADRTPHGEPLRGTCKACGAVRTWPRECVSGYGHEPGEAMHIWPRTPVSEWQKLVL